MIRTVMFSHWGRRRYPVKHETTDKKRQGLAWKRGNKVKRVKTTPKSRRTVVPARMFEYVFGAYHLQVSGQPYAAWTSK